jgi:hypothetical protein
MLSEIDQFIKDAMGCSNELLNDVPMAIGYNVPLIDGNRKVMNPNLFEELLPEGGDNYGYQCGANIQLALPCCTRRVDPVIVRLRRDDLEEKELVQMEERERTSRSACQQCPGYPYSPILLQAREDLAGLEKDYEEVGADLGEAAAEDFDDKP